MASRLCPKKLRNNNDIKELTRVFGSEDRAFAFWRANNGQPFSNTFQGVRSELYQKLLAHTDGNTRQAMIIKSRLFTTTFMSEFGNWKETGETINDKLDEYGEPKFSELSKAVLTIPKDPFASPELEMDEAMAYSSSFNKLFFDFLVNDVEEDGTITPKPDVAKAIFDASKNIDSIYYRMGKFLESGSYGEVGNLISNNFTFFAKEHRNTLRQYGITINNEFAEEDSVPDTYSWRESNKVDLTSILPNETKLLIAGITASDSHVNKISKRFNQEALVDFQRMANLLNNTLAQSGNITHMMQKLSSLIIEYPELSVLLERLRVDKNGEFLPGSSQYQMTLRNQFYRSFDHNKNVPLIVVVDSNGVYSFIDATENIKVEVLKAQWLNNMRNLMSNDVLIVDDGSGNPIVHKKKLVKVINALFSKQVSAPQKFQFAKQILNNLGIIIHERQGKENDPVSQSYPIMSYLEFLNQYLKKHDGPLSINDMFNPEVMKVQKEVKQLVDYSITLLHNDTNLMYFNQEGNMEWTMTLNSALSSFINSYNSITDTSGIPDNVKHLLPYSKENPTGNIFSMNSQFAPIILNGGRLELAIIKGIKSDTGNGQEIQSTKPGEYNSIVLNALLRGYVPALRMADRGLDYAIKNPTYNVRPEEDNLPDRFSEISMGYIKDELTTSFARLLSPNLFGGTLSNYNENVKRLRVFNYIYDQTLNKDNPHPIPDAIEDFVAGKRGKTISRFQELANQFVEDNKDYLDTAFKLFFEKNVEENTDSFIDSGVFYQRSANDFLTLGVDTEMMDKLETVEHTGGIVDKSNLKQLTRIATYQHYLGAQEQLRLVYGDIAMFKDSVDFHKRTTGAGSTRYSLENSQETIDILNETLPRFNGSHKKTFTKIIHSDVFKQAKDIPDSVKKLYPEYKTKSNVTDAQSGALLDMYRSTMSRHGEWLDEHEMIYQWEMQNMVLKVLANEEYAALAPYITSEVFTTGVFAEHTNGEIPTTPMFRGTKMSINNLKGTLPILKPMGYGNISNIANINAVSYFKTSMAPLFPSEMGEEMFTKYLSWLENDTDVVTFISAEKGTIELKNNKPNQWGEVDNLVSSEMSFDHFGIQLDVHEKTTGTVTKSAQRNRLEFLNLYDNGELSNSEQIQLDTLRKEYYSLTNDNIEEDRNQLIADLGLTQSEEGFVLTDENTNKFLDKLEELFIMKNTPTNAINGLREALKQNIKVFDSFTYKQKIEEILMSTIKNNVIKRTTTGDLLIQESNIFFDNTLKFYTPGNPMEVMISLPRQWVDYVESLGGLDTFNKMLAAKDSKLGKDIYKILDFSSNRIPSQALSSLEAVRVVKFLNPYGGPRIVLPGEITVKAGSDFDIDKLTSYFNSSFVEEKILIDNAGRKGDENRLNKISFDSLLSKSRFNELIRPNNSDNLNALAKEVAIKQGDTQAVPNANTEDIIGLGYNLSKSFQFWTSKANVALAAVQNSAHAFSQQYPSSLSFKEFNIYFDKQQRDEATFYRDGFISDVNGNNISDSFAEFLTAFVDAVKDPFVFRLNVVAEVFNAYSFLHRFGGVEGSTDISTLVSFFTQPVILDYMKEVSSNTNIFNYKNRFDSDTYKATGKEDIINNTIKKLARSTTGTMKGVNTYKKTMAHDIEYLTTTADVGPVVAKKRAEAKQRLASKVAALDYKYFSKDNLDKELSPGDNIQILDNFLSYVAMGKFMSIQQKVTRADASQSVESDIFSSQKRAILYGWLNANGILDYGNLKAQVEDKYSLIKEPFKTHEEAINMFGNFFYTKSDDTVLKYFLDNFVIPLSYPNSPVSEYDKKRVSQKFENDFYSFLYGLKFGHEVGEAYNSHMTGESSAARLLSQAKKEGEFSYILDELTALINQFVPRLGRDSEVDNISTFGKRFSVDESNLLTASLDNLRRTNSALYEAITEASMIQSGLSNSPITFNTLIPNSDFVRRMSSVIESFDVLTEGQKETLLNNYKTQFYKNSWGDSKIIKRASGVIYNFNMEKHIKGDLFTRLEKSKSFKDLPYVTIAYYPLNKVQNKKMKDAGKKIPVEIALFKNLGNGTFELEKKLGDGYKFKEYYPLSSGQEASILSANNYDLASIRSKILNNKVQNPAGASVESVGYQDVYSEESTSNTPLDTRDKEVIQYNPNDNTLIEFGQEAKIVPKVNLLELGEKKEPITINASKQNMKELRKELNTVKQGDYTQVVEKFDELYPNLAGKFTGMEKISYSQTIAKGQLRIVCGI